MEKKPRSEARKAAYDLIDGERDYQDRQAGPSATDGRWAHGGTTTVAGDVLSIAYYVFLMIEAWVTKKGDRAAMDIMRKVAGMAVRSMEQHPTPARGEDDPHLIAARVDATVKK